MSMGGLASSEQDWQKADDLFREGLSGANLIGTRDVAHALRDYAAICGARGDHRRAVRIFGATSSVLDSADKMLPGCGPEQLLTSSPPHNGRSETMNLPPPGQEASRSPLSR